jgi:hypothetical protein
MSVRGRRLPRSETYTSSQIRKLVFGEVSGFIHCQDVDFSALVAENVFFLFAVTEIDPRFVVELEPLFRFIV